MDHSPIFTTFPDSQNPNSRSVPSSMALNDVIYRSWFRDGLYQFFERKIGLMC